MEQISKQTKYMTKEQKKVLIQYMTEHPELNSGKFTNDFTFKKAREMWEELAKLLNAMPGCNKEWDKWRKTWHDLKNATKSKAAATRRSQNKTGGGISPVYILDNEENQLLNMLNPMQIEGLPIHEAVTIFSFDDVKGKSVTSAVGDNNEKQSQNVNETNVSTPENKGKRKIVNKRENRVKRLNHTIQATEKLSSHMEEKLKIKKIYYRKKLALLKADIASKNRIANALEGIGAALRSS